MDHRCWTGPPGLWSAQHSPQEETEAQRVQASDLSDPGEEQDIGLLTP